MKEPYSTEELLERKSERRLVLRLGVPAMFGQFFNILYSIVDRIFVGRIPGAGEMALASIGVCAPALTAVTAFAYMVGIGGASLMSISLGKKDRDRAQQIIGTALAMLIAIAVTVTAVLAVLHEPLLYVLGCSEAMYPYARLYFLIYLSGTLVSLLGTGLNQFVLAQGFAREGMISVVIGAAANLIFDPLLIYGCRMGVAGAALGTVLSQACMAAYVIWFLRTERVPIRLRRSRVTTKLVRQILSIGFMSFLITLLDNGIIILLNASLRAYGGAQGDSLIVCATVVQSFLTIVCCPSQGVTTGCGTIFGYHYGAGNYAKLRQAFLWMFLLCAAYIGALEAAVQLFPHVFAGLFLRKRELLPLACDCLRMYTAMLLGVAVQYALVDGLTAMGKIRYALPLSLFRKAVYIVCVLVIPRYMDVKKIFWAGTVSDLIGASFSAMAFLLVVSPKLKAELTQKEREAHA